MKIKIKTYKQNFKIINPKNLSESNEKEYQKEILKTFLRDSFENRWECL